MFKRILLPVDLTDRHRKAVEVAAELAIQGKAVVTLLHVIETIAGLPMTEEPDFYRRLERVARSHFGPWGKQLEEHAVTWQAEVRYGDRARETVRYAMETANDLILLTAPRIDPANPAAGWGSLSYKIGILSPCPVLLVK